MQPDEVINALDQPQLLDVVFYPRKEVRQDVAGAEDFEIPVSDGAVLGARWYKRDSSWPTLLYFHGNGETVSDHDHMAPWYHDLGLNLFVSDYRGYGWSTGRPSFRALIDDTKRVADFFLERLDDGAPTPLLMGRSLGSSPACSLALERGAGFRGLILESGFSNVVALLNLFGIRFSAGEEQISELLSNHLKLRRIELPVLLLHGELDRLIRPDAARENHANIAHDKKTLCILEGVGHNDILLKRTEYFRAIREFVGP